MSFTVIYINKYLKHVLLSLSLPAPPLSVYLKGKTETNQTVTVEVAGQKTLTWFWKTLTNNVALL